MTGRGWLRWLIAVVAVLARRLVSAHVVDGSVELVHGKRSGPIEVLGIRNRVAGRETAREIGGAVVRKAGREATQTME